MNQLSPEMKLIAALQGEVHALRVGISALLASMPQEQQPAFAAKLEYLGEWTIANVLGLTVPEEVNQAFASELQSMRDLAAVR